MRLLIITAVLMCISGAAYVYFREKAGNRSLAFKALATSMAVLAGLCAGGKCSVSGSVMTLGLVFCMIADVILELDFKKGMAVFGGAHICFLFAYYMITAPAWYTIVCAVLIYSIILWFFRKDINKLEELKAASFAYMAVLALMASYAATVWIRSGTFIGAMLLTGAASFVISDCIIAWRRVNRRKSLISGSLVLILYYGAVYLFGAAVYMGM